MCIVQLIHSVDTANIWALLVDGAGPLSFCVVHAGAIASVQETSCFRKIHVLAAQAALCAREAGAHLVASDESHFRVLAVLPISNGSVVPRLAASSLSTSPRCISFVQFSKAFENATSS